MTGAPGAGRAGGHEQPGGRSCSIKCETCGGARPIWSANCVCDRTASASWSSTSCRHKRRRQQQTLEALPGACCVHASEPAEDRSGHALTTLWSCGMDIARWPVGRHPGNPLGRSHLAPLSRVGGVCARFLFVVRGRLCPHWGGTTARARMAVEAQDCRSTTAARAPFAVAATRCKRNRRPRRYGTPAATWTRVGSLPAARPRVPDPGGPRAPWFLATDVRHGCLINSGGGGGGRSSDA